MSNKVLIIGNGGREHALAWKLAQSSKISKIYIASGNGGTAQIGENIPIDILDIKNLLSFALKENIDLTIVGPEGSLALGIVDVFRSYGLPVFGPDYQAAKIETSKIIAKMIMVASGIPTASFKIFNQYGYALEYINKRDPPFVIKADGLSLGKGTYVCNNIRQAKKALKEIMADRVYGHAGDWTIIENFIKGEEASFHFLCDGKNYVSLLAARDYKPALDGNQGLNTGGMGAIVPAPIDNKIFKQVEKKIIKPTLDFFKKQGQVFTGCLYPGVKITLQGLKVLEFNARFGDPETQPYMRLLKNDLFEVIKVSVEGRLAEIKLEWEAGFAVCVILVSGGYPKHYKTGFLISGIDEAEKIPGIKVFHSGTICLDGKVYTAGGRVLGVTATGSCLEEALGLVYEGVKRIKFDDMRYREDIGRENII